MQVAGLTWDWTGSNPATNRNHVEVSVWKKKKRCSGKRKNPDEKS